MPDAAVLHAFPLEQLRRLSLQGASCSGSLLEPLPRATRLHHLDLSHCCDMLASDLHNLASKAHRVPAHALALSSRCRSPRVVLVVLRALSGLAIVAVAVAADTCAWLAGWGNGRGVPFSASFSRL